MNIQGEVNQLIQQILQELDQSRGQSLNQYEEQLYDLLVNNKTAIEAFFSLLQNKIKNANDYQKTIFLTFFTRIIQIVIETVRNEELYKESLIFIFNWFDEIPCSLSLLIDLITAEFTQQNNFVDTVSHFVFSTYSEINTFSYGKIRRDSIQASSALYRNKSRYCCKGDWF